MPMFCSSRNRFLLCSGVLTVLLCLLFTGWPVLLSLSTAWQLEEYSHGYFIPVLAFLVGCHELNKHKPRVAASWWGVIGLLLSACVLTLGRISAFEPLTHYGFLLACFSTVLTFLGRDVARVLLPAFVYLLFAIPLPRLIYVALSQDLQLISSSLGTAGIRLFGLPVFRDGNVIDLGVSKLQVVEACSGLRYLFPLMSFGYLMAWLLEDRLWKKALLFLSTVPITVLINALRIAVIGVTVNYWGKGMAEGLTHDMEGWTLFLVCLLLLSAEVWLLLRWSHTGGRFRVEYFDIPVWGRIEGEVRGTVVAAAVIVSAGMALTIGTGWLFEREEIVPSHPRFADFPMEIGAWQGRAVALERNVLDTLLASDYWQADYQQEGKGTPVNFFMAFYDSQKVGTSAHSPSNCIPGSGWHVLQHSTTPVTLADGSIIEVSRLYIKRDEDIRLVYYWFDERGRTITEQYGAKWYLLLDSILMHRSDGGIVRLVTPVESEAEVAIADKRIQDFLRQVYPQIRHFIPGRDINAP